jgi:molybdate transport system substrate-binding protein
MTTAMEALADKFKRAGACSVALGFGTVGALQARLAAGETADVLILGAQTISKMEQSGEARSGSRREIARTSIGVAVREGTPEPDISTEAAFRRALVGARVVAVSDPAVGGSAGVHLAALWERMGLADEMARKILLQPSGAEVAARVAEGRADLGLTLIAEIVPVSGARVVGKIPAPLGNDVTYAAGMTASCSDPTAAAAFIAALVDPLERDLWAAAGFECIG